MFHKDTSHAGNDCWISEHWYCVSKPAVVAIKLVRVSGVFESDLEVSTYKNINDDMPSDVKRWFVENS